MKLNINKANREMLFPKTIFLVLFFLLSFAGRATIYYIDVNGNDVNGTGAKDNPWKTLYKACIMVPAKAGHIIHVNAGTFIESKKCQLPPGVSIEGEGVSSVLKSSLTADYTEMIALYSSTEGTDGNQHISNVKIDGQNLATYWGIKIEGRKNVSLHDITMVDFKDRGIIFAGRSDNNNGPPKIYATGNSVYNCIITNCAGYNLSTGQYGRGCLNIGGQEGMLIYNNTISQTSRPEGFNGWPIKGWNEGYLKGCKIYNNTLNKKPLGNANGSTGWDFAIELFNEEGMEIYGNTISGGGIDLNFQRKGNYAYSVWIHDNTIFVPVQTNFGEAGITLEFITEYAIIENNRLTNQNKGIIFTPRNGDTVSNITIQKNRMTNIGSPGQSGYFIQFNNNTDPIYFNTLNVYNNTMIGDPGHKNYYGIGLPYASSGSVTTINILNNVIANAQALLRHGGKVFIDSLTVKNNNFYGYRLIEDYVGAVPRHYVYSKNLLVIPKFGSNYALSAGSPLINAGINVGLPFTGTAPDIGAYESGAK